VVACSERNACTHRIHPAHRPLGGETWGHSGRLSLALTAGSRCVLERHALYTHSPRAGWVRLTVSPLYNLHVRRGELGP
jgi:hypothetical protein